MSKRPDRSKKLKERNNFTETVVKASLTRVLCCDNKKDVVAAIEKRVSEMSERYNAASVTINLLIRELFDGKDVVDVALPDFWDITFVRQALLGLEDSIYPDPYLDALNKAYPGLVVNPKRRSVGDANIYTFAAIKLSTNIRNHLVQNFEKVVKNYLYNTTTLNKTECVAVQKDLYGWKNVSIEKKPKNGVEVENKDMADPEKVASTLQCLRRIVGEGTIGDGWFRIKENLKRMLRLFVFVNRALEEKKKTYPNTKLFNLLPVSKIRSHFVTIDTGVLGGLLKDVGLSKSAKVIKGVEQEQWDSVFNTKRLAGCGMEFTRTIDTDGVAINVHFRRSKVQDFLKDGCDVTYGGKRVIAVDPGRRNIFTMVEKTGEGAWKEYSLTRQQYYEESGIRVANIKSHRWNKNVSSQIQCLSKVSTKGQSLATFLEYVGVWRECKDVLRSEYSKRRWANSRFKVYGGKKRTFARFLNRVQNGGAQPAKGVRLPDPSNIVLAFGSAKFAPGGKGEMSVPTTRAFKECSCRFKIKLVDEFRTSRVYWKDDSILKRVAKATPDPTSKAITVPVNGLLWCCSTNKQFANKFVNRDVNAAKNIYRCATLPSRPSVFDRKKARGMLPCCVGKVLAK